jgi:hypothetical protein
MQAVHGTVHAAMQRQAAGFVWIRLLGTAGWVGTLAMALERAACMLQHGELGRPFPVLAGSCWVLLGLAGSAR